jgi:N-acetyl sugar amidotransferase
MIRCRLCVIPDTRPDTAFVDGICSGCIAYAARPQIDWAARREQLLALLARARAQAKARGMHYDCIVPSSGGKDSTYQVLTLIELGARPLVVTSSTCHLTPIGRLNIDNLARYATTIEVSPNKAVRAKLNRLGLTMVGDISWPEHVGIFTIPFLVARRTGIPFLFYGENPQNQYGGPLDAQDAQQMTRRWVSEFGGFLGLRPQDLVGVEGLTEADMADYMLPEGAALGIEAHFLGQYLPWDSHRNAEIAAAAGMRQDLPTPANWWEHENLDNAQTGLHDYGMFLKYGFGRGAAQVSVDIRQGRITREVALEWVELHDGAFPETYAGVPLEVVIERIGMNRANLMQALDKFTNHDLFRRVS